MESIYIRIKVLPEDVQEKIIHVVPTFYLHKPFEGGLRSIIGFYFDWKQTPDGYDYWSDLFDSIK